MTDKLFQSFATLISNVSPINSKAWIDRLKRGWQALVQEYRTLLWDIKELPIWSLFLYA